MSHARAAQAIEDLVFALVLRAVEVFVNQKVLKAHKGEQLMDLRAARLAVLPKDALTRFAEQNKVRARGAWIWDILDNLPNDIERDVIAANDEEARHSGVVDANARPVMFEQVPIEAQAVSSDAGQASASVAQSATVTSNAELPLPALLNRDRSADESGMGRRMRFRPLPPPRDDATLTTMLGAWERPVATKVPFVIPAVLPCLHTKRRKPDANSRYYWTCELCGEELFFDGWSLEYQQSSAFHKSQNELGQVQEGGLM